VNNNNNNNNNNNLVVQTLHVLLRIAALLNGATGAVASGTAPQDGRL